MAASLQRQHLPARVAEQPAGSPAQQAFRQAISEVEELRAELHRLRERQAAARQTYWRQVGPVAAATVAARRALYEPLEAALTGGYLSRAETQQVTELLWQNALSLHERFGEDEATERARYAPAPPAAEAADEPAPAPPAVPAHEQAAATAQSRRQHRAQRARAAQAQAADTASQALLQNTKTAYRQLARLHHPDRAAQADAATQQAQTELMQRITAAYAAGDLAALLTLLAGHEAPTAPDAEADALFVRYTGALAQQQALLSQQLRSARQPAASTPWSGTEKQQRTQLRDLKRSLRAETDYLQLLARELREPASLRQLLRELAASGRAGF